MKINTLISAALFAAIATTNVQAQQLFGNVQRVANAPKVMRVENFREGTEAPKAPSVPQGPDAPQAPEMLWNNDDQREFKDLKSKEVSVEVPASKASDIYIENTQRSIQIKTWDQPKVKVVTTVFYEGEGTKVSDEEWFEKLNISVKSLGTGIRIKSGTVSGSGSYTINGNSYGWSSGSGGVAIFNSNGQNIGTKSDVKRYVTIYMPAANKLDIESKYADVTVANNVAKINADITNGNLELQDANMLTLRSKYANVSGGNIKIAEIEFINGRLILKDVDDLDIDTKYSTVELASVQKVNLISTNDEYEFEDVASLQGRKNYGNLRINRLTKSIELDGTNADVKVRNIAAGVDVIKFNNKYADIRLPLRNLKSYTVNYNGPYSNVYADFERKEFVGKDEFSSKSNKDGLASQIRSIQRDLERATGGDGIDSKFTATIGDGKGTKIDMKCQNCTVDFK
jgi:hypothetical protein